MAQPARFEREMVRGWLHRPSSPSEIAMALTHGAGSDSNSPLLIAVAEAFENYGLTVLRFDLPFRQEGRNPFPAAQPRDREGIRRAVHELRAVAGGKVVLAGHSYGGRMSSIAAVETPEIADVLLLLSYPLHPPRKPAELRTAHFANLRTPVVFVHGSRDPFGSIDEIRRATASIPVETQLHEVERAGHNLPPSVARNLPDLVLNLFPSRDASP